MIRKYIVPNEPTRTLMSVQSYEKKWKNRERDIIANPAKSVFRDLLDLEDECLIQGNTDLLMHLLCSERRREFHKSRMPDYVHAGTIAGRLAAVVLSPLYDEEDIITILEAWSQVSMLMWPVNMLWSDEHLAFKYEDEEELYNILAINVLLMLGSARETDDFERDHAFIVGIEEYELDDPQTAAQERLQEMLEGEQCIEPNW